MVFQSHPPQFQSLAPSTYPATPPSLLEKDLGEKNRPAAKRRAEFFWGFSLYFLWGDSKKSASGEPILRDRIQPKPPPCLGSIANKGGGLSHNIGQNPQNFPRLRRGFPIFGCIFTVFTSEIIVSQALCAIFSRLRRLNYCV